LRSSLLNEKGKRKKGKRKARKKAGTSVDTGLRKDDRPARGGDGEEVGGKGGRKRRARKNLWNGQRRKGIEVRKTREGDKKNERK